MEIKNFIELFETISVPETMTFYNPQDGAKRKEISGLKKINLFLGSNNSGKSRLLREILKTDSIVPVFNKSFIKQMQRIANNRQITTKNGHDFEAQIEARNKQEAHKLIEYFISFFLNIDTDSKIKNVIVAFANIAVQAKLNEPIELHSKYTDYIKKTFPDSKNITALRKIVPIFIPAIRSTRQCFDDNTLRNKLSPKEIHVLKYDSLPVNYFYYNDIECFDGSTLYENFKDLLLTSNKGRNQILAFENFLSKEFFHGAELTISLPKSSQRHQPIEMSIKIGNDEDRPIYDLGDGLQQLIILTWPLFEYDKGIVMIEEPELYMHPGLQKRLMQIYASHPRAKNFMFFIATHSNHILDIVNDAPDVAEQVSVYTLHKEDKPEVKYFLNHISHSDHEALRLLGVSNTSVYLANCTLWVEGYTDQLYFTSYIKAYLKFLESEKDKIAESSEDKYAKHKKFLPALQLREGLHYCFAYSAGNSIVHMDFSDDAEEKEDYIEKLMIPIRKLCGRALVISDTDSGKKLWRDARLREELKDRYIELEVIETENLLSPDQIKLILKDILMGKNFDCKNFTQKDYINKRLGSFIEYSIIKNDSKDRKHFLSIEDLSKNPKTESEYKTLKYKTEFAETARKHITFENMSEVSKELVYKILMFILEHNKDLKK